MFVTHAHWDHVGGHGYLRSLNPAVRFVGRDNYADELALGAGAHEPTLVSFFGRDFRLADVLTYKPDVAIDRPVEMVVGGTRFSLLPTRGGETRDALLVHMPDQVCCSPATSSCPTSARRSPKKAASRGCSPASTR